jgi:hypothetical protein
MHLPLLAGATISLGPLLAWLGTTAGQAVATAVIGAIVAQIIFFLNRALKKIGINITDDQWAVVRRTAEQWAAVMWAKEDASLATAQVNVGDERIAHYANLAVSDIPKIASALGLTPQRMAEFLVAEIGKLQAKALNVSPSK